MPAQTVEIVRKREAALARRLAERRGDLAPPELRGLRKRLRRAQRKRRSMEAAERRRAGTSAASETAE